MSLSLVELERYSQQLKLPAIGVAGQLQLKNAKVLCVGAGGLGCSLLLYLAAAGVGNIGIMDPDRIELSNLHRQVLYQHAHIGQQKALIAKQQLLALNADIHIEIFPEQLTSLNAEKTMSQFDIIVDCSDNFTTRYLINDIAFLLDKPHVFARVEEFSGQCALFLGKKSACFRCLFPIIPQQKMNLSCEGGGILGLVPGLLGILQANETIKWILNTNVILQHHFLEIDILTMNIKNLHVDKNPECDLCSH